MYLVTFYHCPQGETSQKQSPSLKLSLIVGPEKKSFSQPGNPKWSMVFNYEAVVNARLRLWVHYTHTHTHTHTHPESSLSLPGTSSTPPPFKYLSPREQQQSRATVWPGHGGAADRWDDSDPSAAAAAAAAPLLRRRGAAPTRRRACCCRCCGQRVLYSRCGDRLGLSVPGRWWACRVRPKVNISVFNLGHPLWCVTSLEVHTFTT